MQKWGQCSCSCSSKWKLCELVAESMHACKSWNSYFKIAQISSCGCNYKYLIKTSRKNPDKWTCPIFFLFFYLEVSEEYYFSFKMYFSPIFSLFFIQELLTYKFWICYIAKPLKDRTWLLNFWREMAILSVDDRMDLIVISHLGYEFSIPIFNGLV